MLGHWSNAENLEDVEHIHYVRLLIVIETTKFHLAKLSDAKLSSWNLNLAQESCRRAALSDARKLTHILHSIVSDETGQS